VSAREQSREVAARWADAGPEKMADAISNVWEPILRGVLDFMATGGWTQGKLANHERRDGIDLATMEPRTDCRCGEQWPCPVATAYEALT
jgi:hypothetical protein